MPGEGIRPMFRSLAIAASGLSAQRKRIETIATNIANAETTRTPEGGPYRRRVVALEEEAGPSVWFAQPPASHPLEVPQVRVPDPLIVADSAEALGGVRVSGVVEDGTEGPLVYDPSHPDADETGYVRYPNVNITEEMMHLMESRRVYEANATVFQAVKSMLKRATEI